jgi:hypothetical protein
MPGENQTAIPDLGLETGVIAMQKVVGSNPISRFV